jgi:GTP-binding protein HflX
LFDRPNTGERAILVHLDVYSEKEKDDISEFRELALSAGAEPLATIVGSRDRPNPRYFVGTGKLEELLQAVQLHEVELVMFNHTLSPSQERNLEKELQCRVIDRTGLILDIFAQRARTHEGKLQVELAQLEHMSTRLIRGWTHLERQKGGIGLRGPGETQLETDRRLLRARIKYIQGRLEKVRKQRIQGRRARVRAEIPTVSLVGYTNAGKSTLFNKITEASVYAADQLFATLDPTLRRIELPELGPVVLADTVGFIRHLPHKLVEAFRATLEETCNATLLLHIIDAHDDNRLDNIKQVQHVLKEIDAHEIPQLSVYNKLDLLEGMSPRTDINEEGNPERVWVSAVNGDGIDLLLKAVAELLLSDVYDQTIKISPEMGRLRAKLYELGAVNAETHEPDGNSLVSIRLQVRDWRKALSKLGIKEDTIEKVGASDAIELTDE